MISRRKLLQSIAWASAAPLSSQLASRVLALESGAAKPAILFYFFPEGTTPNLFFPVAGKVSTLPTMSQPLTPWLSRSTFIDGLAMYNPQRGLYNDHYAQEAALAAYTPTSIDMLIAQNITDTPVASARIGVASRYWVDKGGNSRLDGVPLYCEDSPIKLYRQLFGQGPTAQDAKIAPLQKSVGQDVAQKIEQQLDGLADLHLAVNNLRVPPLNLRGQFTSTTDFSFYNNSHNFGVDKVLTLLDIQQDIAAMALALGVTRCINFMVGHEFWPVPVVANLGALELAHTGGALFAQQVRWHMDGFSRLLAKLNALPGDKGSVLDNTFCLTYSNMGVNNIDSQSRMPYVLAGGQNFGHIGGWGLDYRASPQDSLGRNGLPHAQLYTALAQKMGLNITSFGNAAANGADGGGALPGLWTRA